METSPLIWGANQWTGFYMITASVMKGLREIPESLLTEALLFGNSKVITSNSSLILNKTVDFSSKNQHIWRTSRNNQ